MATHSSILTWKIPWTEEPGRLQSMGLQRLRHNWVSIHTICVFKVTFKYLNFKKILKLDQESILKRGWIKASLKESREFRWAELKRKEGKEMKLTPVKHLLTITCNFWALSLSTRTSAKHVILFISYNNSEMPALLLPFLDKGSVFFFFFKCFKICSALYS